MTRMWVPHATRLAVAYRLGVLRGEREMRTTGRARGIRHASPSAGQTVIRLFGPAWLRHFRRGYRDGAKKQEAACTDRQ